VVVMQRVIPATMSRIRQIADGVPENARQQMQSQIEKAVVDAFIELSENAEVVNWRTARKYTVHPELSSEPDTSDDRSISADGVRLPTGDKNFNCASFHQAGPATQNTTNALYSGTARAENCCSQTASVPAIYHSPVTIGIKNTADFHSCNLPEHEFTFPQSDSQFCGEGITQSNDPFMVSDFMENDLELFQNGLAIVDSGYASGQPLSDVWDPYPAWSCLS